MAKLYSVAVCLSDLAYGGPEEGGWYFSTGEPDSDYTQFTRTFRNEDSAYSYRDRLERKLVEKLNKGRRPVSSVLSRGVYVAAKFDGLPEAWPKERPFYE